LLLGAANPAPNPFPFLVEASSQQQRWLPRPASPVVSSSSSQQQQPSPVSAVRAVPIRGRGPPTTRPSVRRGRFPRPPARLPVPEPSSPGCRSSSAWPPSARISTVAACRGFFRRRPLWLLARRRRSARPRPSTAAAARLRLPWGARSTGALPCSSSSFAARVREQPVAAPPHLARGPSSRVRCRPSRASAICRRSAALYGRRRLCSACSCLGIHPPSAGLWLRLGPVFL